MPLATPRSFKELGNGEWGMGEWVNGEWGMGEWGNESILQSGLSPSFLRITFVRILMRTRVYRTLFTAVCFLIAAPFAKAENWGGFRGPTGQGISSETEVPLHWSATENVAWKTAIPGEGWSSPIIHGDQVFVTSTTDEGKHCHVVCVDRRSGEILWNTKVFEQNPTKKRRENSFATPTPVTDGQQVYAVFSGGGIAALNLDGKIAWTNRDVTFYSHHGLSASPILFEDLLIMPYDGSSDGENNKIGWKIPWEEAVLLAVDTKSGKVRWRGKRGPSRIAHATPNVLRENGTSQIVSSAGDVVQGFDPKSGARIWSIHSKGEGVTPSIVVGDGLVFSCSGFEAPTIRVIRTGGKGEITNSHVAWEQTKGVPSLASMLYLQPYLYSVTDDGIVTCFHAKTGELIKKERIGGKHSSSPVYADGKIYFLTEGDAESIVIEAGPELKVVARNTLGEKCQASMGISQGNFFIRCDEHLYCIGKKTKT